MQIDAKEVEKIVEVITREVLLALAESKNLSGGFYIYRLKTDKYTQAKKLLLLK